MKAIIDYINNKQSKLLLSNSLVHNLESALLKWAESQGYTFSGFGYNARTGMPIDFFDNEGWWEQEWLREEAFPLDITSEGRSIEEEGVYIHILNNKVEDLDVYLRSFKEIQGEICVSEAGDEYMTRYSNPIGILIKGRLTAKFDFDCWSEVRPDGKRVATRGSSDSWRTEGWIIPSKSEIIGIVSDSDIDVNLPLNVSFETFEEIWGN